MYSILQVHQTIVIYYNGVVPLGKMYHSLVYLEPKVLQVNKVVLVHRAHKDLLAFKEIRVLKVSKVSKEILVFKDQQVPEHKVFKVRLVHKVSKDLMVYKVHKDLLEHQDKMVTLVELPLIMNLILLQLQLILVLVMLH